MKSRSNDRENMPLLSIAIPAYNVEAYLEKCVNSLILESINADLVEVIIVDDGSSDRTKEIAERLVGTHPNVRLIAKSNGGHGSAINVGLLEATGKYFKLLDGDDWLDTKALARLVRHLQKTDSDIVLTDYVEFYSNSKTTKPIKNYSSLEQGVVYDLNSVTPFSEKGPLLATTTFRTDLYKSDLFTIDENCFYVDMEYNLFIYERASNVEYIPIDLYLYRLEREGQSMQLSSIVKNYLNHENVLLRISSELSKAKDLPDTKRTYLRDQIVAPMARSHYQILTEYIGSPHLFNKFDKKLIRYPEVYHSPLVSGKIIRIHRVGRGLTVIFDVLLRKLGGVVNSLEKK